MNGIWIFTQNHVEICHDNSHDTQLIKIDDLGVTYISISTPISATSTVLEPYMSAKSTSLLEPHFLVRMSHYKGEKNSPRKIVNLYRATL